MTQSILDHAIAMEETLNKRFKKLKDEFTLKYASVWILTPTLEIKRIAKGMDVYDLLDNPKTLMAIGDADSFTVVTCGWAAPIEKKKSKLKDLAPSNHPERRRVRLAVSVDYTGIATVLRFKDTPDETITDEGAARGSLADAIKHLMDMKKKKYN